MTKDEEEALKHAPSDWINGPEWTGEGLADFVARVARDATKARFPDLIPEMSDEELAERMRKRNAQLHAALCYDLETEARTFPRKPSIHDE